MVIRVKYLFFVGVLLVTAIIAFRAGEKGIRESKRSRSQNAEKLFRSIPLFNHSTPDVPEEITTENISTERENKKEKATPSEYKKEEMKKKEEKKSKEEQNFKGKNIKPKNSTSTFIENNASSEFIGSTRFVYVPLAVQNDIAKKEKPKQQKLLREKKLPEFSETYVPVYRSKHLTEEALSHFSQKFSGSQNPYDKLFVIGKEIAAAEGRQYEILVFDEKGQNSIGSFSSASSTFPFQGVPSFERVNPTSFKEVSRFFVISNPNDISDILTDESHLQYIFSSAYKNTLDAEERIGTDPLFNLEIYTLFPGIYVADRLR